MSVQTLDARDPSPYGQKPVPTSALAHIPGDNGWPLVGHTLVVLSDPKGFVERRAERYGPVYRSHAFGQSNVSLLGPDANEFVLLDSQKLFSSMLGWSVLLGRLFPRGLMLLDFDEHRLHRRALSVAFKSGPDAVLSRPAQCRHRQRPGAMAVRARVQILPGRQATDARSRGDVVSRRGARSGARSCQARLHRHGRRLRRRDSRAIAGDADGPRRARSAHRSSIISTGRSRCGASVAATICFPSFAARPGRTDRFCRMPTSLIT